MHCSTSVIGIWYRTNDLLSSVHGRFILRICGPEEGNTASASHAVMSRYHHSLAVIADALCRALGTKVLSAAGVSPVQVRADAKKLGISETQDSLFAFFLERVRTNLHVVLCLSPIGEAFRERCRMFPGLVNCTTIDWFTPWPSDALFEVASKLLESADVGTPEIRKAVCQVRFQACRYPWLRPVVEPAMPSCRIRSC